ncbi:hypothetical protein RYA05_00790 [Pseudomonas syringae pv. actinidiae]|nr:hypothetical protein [Pseudomonas syringae pv. actinidiae]
MKYLKPEHTVHLRKGVAQLEAFKEIAGRIENDSVRDSLLAKADAHIARMVSEYDEDVRADGTILVKHPSIGYLRVEEKRCDQPVRMFSGRIKSLSSVMLTLYRADALVLGDGNVDYINRTVFLQAEMSQAAFAGLMANPGRGKYPMRIHNLGGEIFEAVNDLESKVSEAKMNKAMAVTDGIGSWADKIVAMAKEKAEKGGVLSAKGRQDVSHLGEIMHSWASSDPEYHASTLAEHTSSVANEIKLEVMAAVKLKGGN